MAVNLYSPCGTLLDRMLRVLYAQIRKTIRKKDVKKATIERVCQPCKQDCEACCNCKPGAVERVLKLIKVKIEKYREIHG